MLDKIVKEFNKFLLSSTTEKEFHFKDGYYLKVKKHIKKGKHFLEIHTSGYDGTLEITEAIEWIKWTLIDLQADGILC